jgi:hypothetical protein
MRGRTGREGPGLGVFRARLWKPVLVSVGLLMMAPCAGAADDLESADSIELRIDAPTMMAALVQFSQQTGLQLLFPTDGATRLAAPRVEGHLTPRAALEQLLRDSGLTFEFVNARTVSVSSKPEPRHAGPHLTGRE